MADPRKPDEPPSAGGLGYVTQLLSSVIAHLRDANVRMLELSTEAVTTHRELRALVRRQAAFVFLCLMTLTMGIVLAALIMSFRSEAALFRAQSQVVQDALSKSSRANMEAIERLQKSTERMAQSLEAFKVVVDKEGDMQLELPVTVGTLKSPGKKKPVPPTEGTASLRGVIPLGRGRLDTDGQ